MENFLDSKWFPWVLGGGALIGLYLIFGGSSSSASTTSADAANASLIGLQAQLGTQLAAQQATLSAQTEQSRIAAEATDTATIAGTFANLMAAKQSNELGMAQVAAGVQTAQIGASTATSIEQMQQLTNRKQIQAAVTINRDQVNGQVQTANIQGNTAQNIAHTQASAQVQSQALGIVPNILKVFGF